MCSDVVGVIVGCRARDLARLADKGDARVLCGATGPEIDTGNGKGVSVDVGDVVPDGSIVESVLELSDVAHAVRVRRYLDDDPAII